MTIISVETREREEMYEISEKVSEITAKHGGEGIATVFVRHTTCAITVNENADPDVQSDMLGWLRRIAPQDEPHFRHAEQNSDAHIKASLVGCAASVPFVDGKLQLGRWQGIFLCEFDGPRKREVAVTMLPAR